ncbi:hypothetical protein evm_009875 [Chilo suppressalis]|nr:hypothetical protein evm_009875 [Chilo suppressalis]
MADAEARREARRKRILENSHNRLQLISGKCSSEDFSVTSQVCTNVSPIPQNHERSSSPTTSGTTVSVSSIHNGGLGVSRDSFEPLITGHENASGDDEVIPELTNWIPSMTPATPEQSQIPLWKSLITHKYDILLLSLFLQLLHALTVVPFENSYFFVPLIIYSVTKSVWLPKQSNSSIGNIILLLNGMSSNGLHKIVNILMWVSAFTQDACIFLFTTICVQSFYNIVKESFVT